MKAELDRQRRAVRSSTAARVETARLLDQYRRSSDADSKKIYESVIWCTLSKRVSEAISGSYGGIFNAGT